MAGLGRPLAALVLLLASALSCAAVSSSRKTVIGSGASPARDVLQSFASTVNKKYGTRIRYNDVGSGAGRSQFIGSSTLYCATNVPMPVEEEARMAGYVKFTLPLAINTITAFTSLPGADGIRLDARALAKIFAGAVKVWNDPVIKALNPKLSLPASAIKVVARKDALAAATVLFTQWLSVFAKKDWPLGSGGQIKWPSHVIQVPLTAGVLKYTKKHRNAITYADTGLGIRSGVTEVAIRNKAGNFILASQSNPKLSVPRTLPPAAASWAAVSLIGESGGKAWPITSFLYILARKNQVQVGIAGGILKAWLIYIMSPGVQPLLSNFQLSGCPPSILRKNRAAIYSMQLTPGVTVPTFK